MTDSLSSEPGFEGGSEDFRRAIAVMAGRPGQADVVEALALLGRASESGEAAASERLALFTALGLTAPPDWPAALDLLALASAQGSRPASEQLQLLAEPDRDPSSGPSDKPAAIRQSIDIAGRLRHAAGDTIRTAPFLRRFAGFATAAECRWLIRSATRKLVPATVFDRATGRQVENPVRDNHAALYQVAELDFLAEVVRQRISNAVGIPVPFFEPPQIFRYTVGQQFKLHPDYFDPANPGHVEEIAKRGQRVGTFLLYLNDDYEGGATHFPAIGLDWRGGTGDALFFANVDRTGRPDRQTLHAGQPPSIGEKWVFSQWIRDRLPNG